MKAKTYKANWSVMQRADDPDVKRANQQLKADIKGGATGVALVFEGAHNSFGFGLPGKPETIAELFNGVDLAGLHIRLDNHPHGRIIADAFVDYVNRRKISPDECELTFSIDPTVVLATTGHLKMTIEALKASLPQSMSGFFSSGLPGIVLEADGRLYHNAGATEAQELGAVLSVALAHLRMVEEARHHIVYALPHIGFALALDQDVAKGLAKIKALRLLWRKLQQNLGIASPVAASIHVETSMRMMSTHYIENNISRAALAALAAVSGEVKSLSIVPHNMVFGLPNANARRIARDSQLILAHEIADCRELTLAKNDIDHLTDAAWSEFERFEAAGGVLKCLIDGTLAKNINDARDLRIANLITNGRSNIDDLVNDPAENTPVQELIDVDYSHYKPEGIFHCEPLKIQRSEVDLADALSVAPIEEIRELA